MWANHLQSMAMRRSKLHPSSSSTTHTSAPAAISFNATNLAPDPAAVSSSPTTAEDAATDAKDKDKDKDKQQQGKITAVVNVPQSRYEYNPLEPPVIETPQLRDMGEATPPLEWIGLNRERLPNLTHQVGFPSPVGGSEDVILTWNADCDCEFAGDCPRGGGGI